MKLTASATCLLRHAVAMYKSVSPASEWTARLLSFY